MSIRLALLLAVAIHVDWHVARPDHWRLSLGWPYHWVIAIPVFAAVAWYGARRWPGRALAPSLWTIAAGIGLGQGLEPVAEALYEGAPLLSTLGAARMNAFVEFIAVGLAAYVATMLGLRTRARRPAPPSSENRAETT